MREIVSAIGERSLIGQVTFPLQFSRVIPTLFAGSGPERLPSSHGNSVLRLYIAKTTIYKHAVESSMQR